MSSIEMRRVGNITDAVKGFQEFSRMIGATKMILEPKTRECGRCGNVAPSDVFGLHECKPMTAKPEQTDEELAARFMGWKDTWRGWAYQVEPAPTYTSDKSKYAMDQSWLDKVKEAGRAKMEFINQHQEELITAFVAKTGLQPDECTLIIQDCASDLHQKTKAYWVERTDHAHDHQKVEPAPKAVPELPEGLKSMAMAMRPWTGEGLNAVVDFAKMLLPDALSHFKRWLSLCDGCAAEDVVAKLREDAR